MMQVSTSAQTAEAIENYFRHDVGRWLGKGAQELELIGEVNQRQFGHLLRGRSPSGLLLVPDHNGIHTAGWQLGFSAPKSVSIQALVEGDERLIAAHIDAAGAAFSEIERRAMAHRRGGSELVITGNLVATAFEHLTSRPVGTQTPDPQLHTHVVFMNMTRRPDGEWRSLRPRQIVRDQRVGTDTYRQAMQTDLARLGYRIETTTHKGEWELAGYNRFHIMMFSRRRNQIQQALNERGWHPHAAWLANLITRQPEVPYDITELRKQWRDRAQELGIRRQEVRTQLIYQQNSTVKKRRIGYAI